jgi:hypothetical protein
MIVRIAATMGGAQFPARQEEPSQGHKHVMDNGDVAPTANESS